MVDLAVVEKLVAAAVRFQPRMQRESQAGE